MLVALFIEELQTKAQTLRKNNLSLKGVFNLPIDSIFFKLLELMS